MSPILATSREIPFSPEQVLAAFRDPRRVERWFGPDGFTNEIGEFDFRPGGAWRVRMRAPNGASFDNLWKFLEISPAKLVMRHVEPVHAFTLTVALDPAPKGTKLGWTMEFDDAAEAERVRVYAVPANEQNLDRLTAELERGSRP